MYTRKQAWRRVNSARFSSPRGYDSDEFEENDMRVPLKKSVSEDNILGNKGKYVRDHTVSTTSLPELVEYGHDTVNRKVRFNDATRVVLVPSLREYKTHGVHADVWWEKSDLRSFEMDARLEFVQLVEKCNGDFVVALKMLHRKWSECNILESILPETMNVLSCGVAM